MADTQVDGAADDVRAAVAQLQGNAPAPEPVTLEPAEHAPEDALERMSRRASEIIEGKLKDEPQQERPARQRDPGGRFAKKQAADERTE